MNLVRLTLNTTDRQIMTYCAQVVTTETNYILKVVDLPALTSTVSGKYAAIVFYHQPANVQFFSILGF